MKTLKLILLSSILILTFKNSYSQARLGYTFDEIDKEFVIDSYSCTDKKFGKNIGYGYHFYIHLDGGIFCHFLNNDLVFHGTSFLTTSLREAKESNAAVYSPTVINASIDQCHWKQMWNWGKGLRQVKWIDFQCPLIRRDVLEIIKQYPQELIYGWGLDFYTGCITETNGLKTIVSDNHTICHLNSQTFKQNKISIGVSEFCRLAEEGMYKYFINSDEYRALYGELRQHGQNYSI